MDLHVKSFASHLADLRGLLIRLGLCLVCGMLLAMPLAPRVYRWLQIPFERSGLDVMIRVTEVGGGFAVFLRIVLWCSLIVSLPSMLVVVVLYLLPAMHERERRLGWQVGAASLLLFILGSMMAYQWTVPVALRFMVRIENWMDAPAMFWEATGYVSFVLRLLLAFGFAFQLPVIVVLLGSTGLVGAAQLRASRSYVITGLFVLAMLLTPPDPFTMVLMALPLTVLFEATIWIVLGMERSRERHAPRDQSEE